MGVGVGQEKKAWGKPGWSLGRPSSAGSREEALLPSLALSCHSPRRAGRSVCAQEALTGNKKVLRFPTDHQPKCISRSQLLGRE